MRPAMRPALASRPTSIAAVLASLALLAASCRDGSGGGATADGGPLVVVVEDATGRPVFGVDVRRIDDGAPRTSLRTGPDGRVELGNLASATIFVVDFQTRASTVYRPTVARVDRKAPKVVLREGPPVVFDAKAEGVPSSLKVVPYLTLQRATPTPGIPAIEHDATRGVAPRRFAPYSGGTRGAVPAPGRYAAWFAVAAADGTEASVPGIPDHVEIADEGAPTKVVYAPEPAALKDAIERLTKRR
jgi:hypothetical protein